MGIFTWQFAAFLASLLLTMYLSYRSGTKVYEDDHKELLTIDEALARRPALNRYPTRYAKVSRACFMAGEYEKSLGQNQSTNVTSTNKMGEPPTK